jgi:hypothetical protein
MGPCIVSIFQYISEKMQRYTVYLYLETALHVLGVTITHLQEQKTTVTAASGKRLHRTVVCCYRGRVGNDLSVLWVAYASGTSP